ncbi:salicylate synthase [Gordonia pseudamarae]|uniref:Salicylate synthase n=2 Tax=Gordonia pseudamarae TaxID=2831662 RepID=A0ABX6IRT2_9ACTN|nr:MULTISPECIES: salicylate synthase [Gordonia]MBD0021837.1 salicylate synthase [Gordonia sp. (in: high G+C Gram-positive bacteria)]QHN28843.1 salicylate synthase [Gordonia pseudamarae]QHN37716.1 salicylate synthase [Gordonia pseudamarae]
MTASTSVTAHAGSSTPADPAQVCAAWAATGRFADYVVYERDGRWTFAADAVARIILTGTDVSVVTEDTTTSRRWVDEPGARPVDALAEAVAALPMADWQLYGWVGFDFAAGHHGLGSRVADDTVLAHVIVPRVELTVSPDGVGGGVEIGGVGLDDDLLAVAKAAADIAEANGRRETPHIDIDSDPYDYRGQVAAAVSEIAAGDYQKVIMSRHVDIPFAVDMPATYARARVANNPMRSYLVSLGGIETAGFSPELVVSVTADGQVLTEPLAGTRPLGRSPEEDAAAREELLNDGKEITEHAVSVRACFEEIESIAEPGSTAVTEFMAIRERGHVQHLASTVRGTLRQDAGPWVSLSVLFPSITASGIPKAPALDAIYRLEPKPRSLYSGAIMTASSAGELEAALVLRSVYAQDGQAWLRSGAGVVEPSRPDREFEETCEKLAGLAPYIVAAQHGDDGAVDAGEAL